nr:voltage dependent calcium channel subunit [Hymenolepis microstoma]
MGTEQLSKMYSGSLFGVQEMTDSYARKLVDDAVSELTQMIRKKERALEKLKNSIEEEFKLQESLDHDECYIRAKAVSLFPHLPDENGTVITPCNESQFLPLESDPMFGNFYISRNMSAAHVPTNVYDLSKEIRTVGNLTHHLDEVFKKNLKEDPLLKWQYFCSSTGFLKFYPGAMWEVQLADLQLDFFDCRSTAWYVGAASYPIEMVILADKSGSMKGRRNTICNATISELLNTLTDDDFFNVIYFSETIKFAEEYIKDRLIQATRPNKDRIVRGFVDHMPNGTSNFRAALKEAFTLLNISANGTGINRCNKMIILITDGVPEDYEDLFEKYNPEKNVRVFTFLLGQHSSDESITHRIACRNRGMDANIANLADVKENVLKYIDIVARSNAILDDSFVRWSGVTKQQLNLMKLTPENFTRPPEPTPNVTMVENTTLIEDDMQEDEFESGNPSTPPMKTFKTRENQFFITLSRAAYNKTNASIEYNKGILLGVTGLDIPMEEFQDALRSWKSGPLSYFFGITNNGFILFHPEYRPLHGAQLKRYYRHVDLDEVEQPIDFTLNLHTALPNYNSSLRRLMIDRSTASTVFTSIETPEDFLSGLPITKKVFTAPLPDTPFVFGLAVRWVDGVNRGFPVPKYDTTAFWRHGNVRAAETRVLNPQFKNPAESCELDDSLHYGSMLNPIPFCKFRRQQLIVFLDDPLCALRNAIIDKALREENDCDWDHVGRIFMDARATANIYDYWRKMTNQQAIRKFDIKQAFSIHQSGFLRYYNYSEAAFETFLDEINKGAEGSIYKSTVLQTTFYENMKMLVFRPPQKQIFRTYMENNLTVPLIVSGAISNPSSEPIVMGIAGIQLSYQKFMELFDSIVNGCESSDYIKCNGTGMQCFLATTAGQIILSTHGEKAVSQNVKELDCALMEALVAENIMTEHEIYDFQAICIEAVTPDLNFASRLFSPVAFLIKLVGKIINEFIMLLTSWWLLGPGPAVQGMWEALPSVQSEFTNFNDFKAQTDNLPYGVKDGSDQFSYPQYGDIDYSLPSKTSGLGNNRDYEILKPFESPQASSFTDPPPLPSLTAELPQKAESTESAGGEEEGGSPELPFFYETAQFYSQKNYVFEDPEDPWLIQQQAFAELKTCYANEPNLNPPPSATTPLPSVYLNTSTNETLDVIDLTDAVSPSGEHIQVYSNNVTLVNATAVNATKASTPRKVNTIPGTLLRCVQRIVQMRCHAAVHSNNQIGRQACEVMCDAVRQRMPQLTEFLHDCRQPLDACTQRHSIFYLNKEAHARSVQQGTYGGGPKSKIHTGTYCPKCGNISIPRAQTYRRDPVTPKTCEMVSYKVENHSTCLNEAQSHLPNVFAYLLALLLAVLRFA